MPDVSFLPAQEDLRCRVGALRDEPFVRHLAEPLVRGGLSKGDLEARLLGAGRAR